MKVIIAGTRTFRDYKLLKSKCDKILSKQQKVEIVSGLARGADFQGVRYAKEKGYKIKKFPADWDTHDKAAGFLRNKEMAEYAEALIAFWDGESKGTAHMIEQAEKNGLKIRVILYKNYIEKPF